MAHTTQEQTSLTQEKTFSTYNSAQSKHYNDVRRDYHPSVYQAVFDAHGSSGGQLDSLVDIGCGPGLATRNVAQNFTHVIGLDPSDGMLGTARSLGGETASGEAIRYEQSTAAELGSNLSSPIRGGSVDLIIATNAARWFDMSTFWPSAARILKPCGTVALWTSGNVCIHPDMPNAVAIQAVIDTHNNESIDSYYNAGNILTRERYLELPLPWTLAEKVDAFDEKEFFRREWAAGHTFHTGENEVLMTQYEKLMSTSSPRQRWREANLDLVGTDQDEIRILKRKILKLLQEAGVGCGKEMIKGTVEGVLLVVKKKA